jgi:hypothetical protein
MSQKQTIILDSSIAKAMAHRAIENAPEGYVAIIQEVTRTIEQNAAQWPILQCFSDQLLWPVNGSMVKLSPDEWKDLLTAAFRKETPRIAAGLDGGVVMLGQRTSKFGKKEFGLWLEFLNYVAAERGVKIIDDRYEGYQQRATRMEQVA